MQGVAISSGRGGASGVRSGFSKSNYSRLHVHLNSELIFERFAKQYFWSGVRVLELGPDGNPSTYRRCLADLHLAWETADLAESSTVLGVRMFGSGQSSDLSYAMDDPYSIPAADNQFDIVFSGQVIEHVPYIWKWMPELARVCKPGGFVITIGPVSWPYHEAPIDCWRVYPEGLKALCEDAGLQVVQSVSASFEPRVSRRAYPGASFGPAPGMKSVIKRVAGAIGWPLPIAIDTIAIARKPLNAT
ncbi:MAG: class I SAM-dependent methyltransferase [Actinomycetota bacterium]|nr:class I SAM-dependent methyltransferase [Actinomycetota bacterium]